MKQRVFLSLLLIASALGALFVTPQAAQASGASFFASPASGTYTVGNTIAVGVYVNTGGNAINAGSGTVTWSSGLQYSSVSTAGSIFSLWTSGGGSGPVGSASSVSFQGGLASPGYNGSSGRVLTVDLKATTPGTFSVNIAGSEIDADDGYGTNVYCCSSGATFTVLAPKPAAPVITVRSSTDPSPSQWYTSHNVALSWSASQAITNYAFSIDHSPGGTPSSPHNATTSTTYTLTDGIWYFHLQGSNANGTASATYVISIDSTPPNPFSVSIDDGGNTSNPTPVANFSATDATSGINHYIASIDGGAPFPISPGVPLPKQYPGNHTIVITAYDQAGNSTSAMTKFAITGIAPPKILKWPSSLAILQPMTYIGQSAPTDTIYFYINGRLIDQFTASAKKAPKSLDKGNGGFPGGITWVYTYHPQLFPSTINITFSRTNSVGAASTPTKNYKLVITAIAQPSIRLTACDLHASIATCGLQGLIMSWFMHNLLWILLAVIAILLLILLVLYMRLSLERYQRMTLTGTDFKPTHIQLAAKNISTWRPFGWLFAQADRIKQLGTNTEDGSKKRGFIGFRKRSDDDTPK